MVDFSPISQNDSMSLGAPPAAEVAPLDGIRPSNTPFLICDFVSSPRDLRLLFCFEFSCLLLLLPILIPCFILQTEELSLSACVVLSLKRTCLIVLSGGWSSAST